jgi:glutathione-regulated potassium-efflux system ancillary protein KefC
LFGGIAIGPLAGGKALHAKGAWITFLAGTGANVRTFLGGAELDPNVFPAQWKESTAVGLVGFFSSTCGASQRPLHPPDSQAEWT